MTSLRKEVWPCDVCVYVVLRGESVKSRRERESGRKIWRDGLKRWTDMICLATTSAPSASTGSSTLYNSRAAYLIAMSTTSHCLLKKYDLRHTWLCQWLMLKILFSCYTSVPGLSLPAAVNQTDTTMPLQVSETKGAFLLFPKTFSSLLLIKKQYIIYHYINQQYIKKHVEGRMTKCDHSWTSSVAATVVGMELCWLKIWKFFLLNCS